MARHWVATRPGGLDVVELGDPVPASRAYRDGVRAQLIDLAARGALQVPLARTFGLASSR